MADESNSTPETPAPVPETASTPITPTSPASVPTPATTAPPAGQTNGLAIAALVVGIVAVVSGWIPFWGLLVGATAVVLGILGLKKATGKGMAIAGIITGALGALWGLVVVVFFIIAITLSATTANTYSTMLEEQNKESQSLIDSKKDFAKGETAKFGDKFEVKVNSVEAGYNPGQYYTPAEGKEYVRVNITIKNTSDDEEYVSAYSFAVLDNGMAKNSTYAPVEQELTSGDLAAGASTTGNIVYEITKDASDLKLQYDITVFDQSYTSKKLVYTLAL